MTSDVDPFGPVRRESGVYLGQFGDETIPLILRHRDVRLAASDVRRFSSNAPARLPIPDERDVRSLRQLPIETDPPDHADYKDLVKPWFRRPVDPDYVVRIERIVDDLLDSVLGREVDMIAEFGLPLQSRTLTVLLNLPESEAEEWISWGTHAFKVAGRNDAAKAARLDEYIHRNIDRVHHTSGNDMFSFLLTARFRGRPLTREEVAGFMHVTFAGGRDTVINTVAGALGWLAENPSGLDRLRAEPKLAITATEEFVRYLSPLSHFGRVCPEPTEVLGLQVAADHRIGLCWASANFDETVFHRPDQILLDRNPNPHLGFGSGPHNCIGSTHARLVIRSTLLRTAMRRVRLEMVTNVPGSRNIGGIQRRQGHNSLVVRFHPAPGQS
jgi:cytochrome P450